MYGFTGLIAKKQGLSKEILPASLMELENLEASSNLFLFRHTNGKFTEDKIFQQSNDHVIGLDGVILNFKALKNEYAISGNSELIQTLYEKHGNQYPDHLRGEFSGFLFNKSEASLLLFTNHTATKQIFYFDHPDYFIFSASLDFLTQILIRLHISYSLNYTAARMLLCYGYMLEDHTLIEGVKKIPAGEIVNYQSGVVKRTKYHDFRSIAVKERKQGQYLAGLEDVFQDALKKEYQKDKDYSYKNLAFLSGGLDSRMNVMTAHELGFKDKHNICFSHPGYLDHKISKQISDDLDEPYIFQNLDNGKYLLDLEENVRLNDGQVFYSGSAHLNYALKKLDFSPYGIIHSGQMGDAILGGLLTSKQPIPPDAQTDQNFPELFRKITSEASSAAGNYPNEETYKLYNHLFNLINSGSFKAEQFSYMVSPFMYPDFIDFALSIPTNEKYFESIYIRWINVYHPMVTRYKWERTKLKPNAPWKTHAGEYINKFRSLFFKRILKDERQTTMTPYSYWWKTEPWLRDFFHDTLKKYSYLLETYPELKEDVSLVFEKGNTIEKTKVLSLLNALKLYF